MLIIKFGGTVLKSIEKVVDLIKTELKNHQKLVIITSAIGRYPDAYATDTLMKMGLNVTEEELAQLVSCGEIISGINLVNELKKEKISAKFLSVYDLGLEINDNLSLKNEIKLAESDIFVIPGFIALKDGKIYLLPRGGSNLTALFFADYYKTNLMIVSDTDGIYEHNPKLCQSRKLFFVSVTELIKIIIEEPRVFPIESIKYFKRNNFIVLYRSLNSKNGSLIGDFSKNSLLI